MAHSEEIGMGEKNRKNREQILKALEIAMKHNSFEFGNTSWIQIGTAMGASPTPMHAMSHFCIHERKTMTKCPSMVFHRRHINDSVESGRDHVLMTTLNG